MNSGKNRDNCSEQEYLENQQQQSEEQSEQQEQSDEKNQLKNLRKSSNQADEIKKLFEFLRTANTPIILWQTDDHGKKKVKTGMVQFVNIHQRKIKFSALQGVTFNFKREIPVYFFTAYKNLFGLGHIWDLTEGQVIINYPNADEIRLAEDRCESRVKTFLQHIPVTIKKKEKKFLLKLEDVSNSGLSFQVSAKEQWHFEINDMIEIETIGKKNFSPALALKILYLTTVTNNNKKDVNTFVKVGGQFLVNLDHDQFIEIITEFA